MSEDLKKILHDNDYKATPARLAILKIFSKDCDPMNTDQVYKKVNKTGLDLVTVYRTLASFEKSGILKQVTLANDAVYYERNLNDHHHIICTKCKKIADFTGCESQSLITKALKQVKGFKSVTHHSFDLFGVCNKCATK